MLRGRFRKLAIYITHINNTHTHTYTRAIDALYGTPNQQLCIYIKLHKFDHGYGALNYNYTLSTKKVCYA